MASRGRGLRRTQAVAAACRTAWFARLAAAGIAAIAAIVGLAQPPAFAQPAAGTPASGPARVLSARGESPDRRLPQALAAA